MKCNIHKKTASITGLTFDQLLIIQECVRRVQRDIEWDEDSKLYATSDSLLLTMDEEDYKTLQSVNFDS